MVYADCSEDVTRQSYPIQLRAWACRGWYHQLLDLLVQWMHRRGCRVQGLVLVKVKQSTCWARYTDGIQKLGKANRIEILIHF